MDTNTLTSIHMERSLRMEEELEQRVYKLPDEETLISLGYDPDERWPEVLPFAEDCPPEFPVYALPLCLMKLVYYLAESTQTPPEMAGLLCLGVLSTAFQGRYTLRVTDDWSEPLCLYLAAVADPGERKSAVLNALMRPVYAYERERRITEHAELEREKQERELLESELALEKKRACRTNGKQEARQRVMELSDRLTALTARHPCRLLADDSTQEKLVELMSEQNGCLTICSSEGGVFDLMRGRYDRGVNLDVYLKGHAGDPITVDRLGRQGSHLAAPRLSMILTIQPEVLREVMGSKTFRGRGLCARFLYAYCHTKVGSRRVDVETVPKEVMQDYNAFVKRILAGTGRGELRLSEGADRRRRELQAEIERKLSGDWYRMRDWGGKALGAMLRIAALLHCAASEGEPSESEITEGELLSAELIGKYLGESAEWVYALRTQDDEDEAARYVWKRIQAGRFRTEYTLTEISQLAKGRLPDADRRRDALDRLCALGYLREELRTGTGGRDGFCYRRNPRTLIF